MPGNQIQRIIAVIDILIRNRRGLTVHEIIQKLEERGETDSRNVRTIQRDIKTIKELGYQLHIDEQSRYLLVNRGEIIGKGFTSEEVQALQMSRDLFRYFDGTHLKRAIDSAIDLIIGKQNTQFSRDSLEELEDNFMVHLGYHRNLACKDGIIDDIVHAINNRYCLQVQYRKPNSPSAEAVLHPYRLILFHDTLYLLAKKHGTDEPLRVYHISRIESASETEDNFERDNNLLCAYEESLKHSFGIYANGELADVELKFNMTVLDALRERVWHQSQEIIEKEDCVLLKMRVLINKEFCAWILSWGKAVIDVNPPQLDAMVREMRG